MTLSRDSDIEDIMPTEKKNINFDTINRLFYDYHSEVESLIMDMIADKIGCDLLDIVFSDLDELQEEYHDRLKRLLRKRCCL
jgi:hypothetical protein